MNRDVTKQACAAEISRFFRYYFRFCQTAESDAAREVLASAYSVNDKLRKAGYPNFFEADEFLAIKAFRNYTIHQGEILSESRALPIASLSPIDADVAILCLLPSRNVSSILASCNNREVSAIEKTCVFYRDYVDIYPCIFNFGVMLFLHTESHQFEIASKDYRDFRNSIEYEREHGYPHFVSGGIRLSDGTDVDDFIENSLLSLDDRVRLHQLFYDESDGMFTLKGTASPQRGHT